MPLPAVTEIAPEIFVGGRALGSQLLTRVLGLSVQRRLRLPARTEIRFDDEGFAASAESSFAPGGAVKVAMADGTVLFEGIITAVEMTLERGLPELTLIADDKGVLLGRKVSARTFQQQKASDIVSQIASEHGLSAKVSATTIMHPYLLQTTSDLALVEELADREGFDWWVQGNELHFAKPSAGGAAVSLTFGEDLTDFSVRMSALHPGWTTVTGWDQAQKQPVVGKAESASDTLAPTPDMAQKFLSPTQLSGASTVRSTLGGAQTQAEGTALARSAVQRWTSGAVLAHGRCDVKPALVPGGSLAVKDAGGASGTYRVTEVRHSYSERGFTTDFVCGDRTPTSLVDSLTGSARPSSFRHVGVVVGIVTAVGNPEDKAAVVKVRYPTVGDSVESHWARVATPGAGASRGLTFLPEINDEVVVCFEGGDLRRPVVLGGVFNGKDLPTVYGNEGNSITKRRITSRLGHFIELADGTGDPDQAVTLALAGGQHTLSLAKDGLTGSVPSGTPISIKAGQSELTIAKDGGITISGKTVTIKATGAVEVSGLSITQKANTTLELSGTTTTVKANAKAEMSSGGMTAISGAVVKIN